ncbi:MAG: chromosome segregation protein SMC [Planctomycetales bacterium]
MLKALDIVGFKSFADKTRFEFSPGVTTVVGPNGSGKSNVVDAVKWVLGEQSAKSLRGKEMSDVIFNGSSSRKPLNCAEVTLTFDNSKSLLPIDSPEVHITRRIFKSGEGEYLINKQPSRLKHIRDLFMGTGAGTDAYSVIEQGKVDRLLQSSPKDRREIFEEAAGISRFKAKKLESLRRLARVDQNLLRLADVVEEVENQLRSVRSQAGKAKRHQELSGQLRELRTQVGFADWRRLTEELETLEGEHERLRQGIQEQTSRATELETAANDLESRLDSSNDLLQQAQRRLTEARERIAGGESTIEHERLRISEWDREISRHRRQAAALNTRNEDLRHELEQTARAESGALRDHEVALERLKTGNRAFDELTGAVEDADHQQTNRESQQREQLRAVAALSNSISSLESQFKAAQDHRSRAESRLAAVDADRGEVESEQERLLRDRDRREKSVDKESQKLARLQEDLDRRREERAVAGLELSELQTDRNGLQQRIEVLEDLDQRQEGVSAGVKEILQQAKARPRGPFSQVKGLVADLFQVSMETAPLIEIALGESAHHLVLGRANQLIAHLAKETLKLEGRVSFTRLDVIQPETELDEDLSGEKGVIGRADQFVETAAEFQPLARRLLGRTWIVESLQDAFELSDREGLEFVTLDHEALKVDGTICLGPNRSGSGLISRRSELRDLRKRRDVRDGRIRQRETAITKLDQRVAEISRKLHAREEKHQTAADGLTEVKQRISSGEGRIQQLNDQRANLDAEARSAEANHQRVGVDLNTTREQTAAAETQVSGLEQGILEARRVLNLLESTREDRSTEVTAAKIQSAKSEERLEGLRTRLRQLQTEQEERRRALLESQSHLSGCEESAERSFWNILRTESQLAETYLLKERLARDSLEFIEQRESVSLERSDLIRQAQGIRDKLRKREDGVHALDLKMNELRHQRAALVDRLKEDYDVDVAQLDHEPTEEESARREETEQEIESLRNKLSKLGSVNLEALRDLEELENRFNDLSERYEDIAETKRTLEQVIQRINTDSRRLFVETLEAVRVHFRELFRKLFGGGQADIVMEEDADPLECGVEIIARPPGKELRSISLMSGGEKTMTCVALLLAIFRNRPSPFCILDEVDAALDEANIDRFVKVVQEFLAWTQFIIVTHSKRTMTAAHTLYGVTMQESGVSKRVSVRFEDVSSNGEITKTSPDDEAA